jgi:hypothetical protein
LNFRPNERVLRQFAAAWLLSIGGLGIWKVLSKGPTTAAVVFAAAGVAVGLIGLLAPHLIRIVYCGALLVTFPIGSVVSTVLLAFLYWGIMTPLGLAFRLIHRDRLRLKRQIGPTCWTPGAPVNSEPERYLRQF